MQRYLYVSLICMLLFHISGCLDNGSDLKVVDGNKVVIIRNTFTEKMQKYNYIKLLLYENIPSKHFKVRNLARSADEINLRPRPLNFSSLKELLYTEKAGIIIACYGLNESFDGLDSLMRFENQFRSFIKDLRISKFNATTNPEIILVSPICYEYLNNCLRNGEDVNSNLELYSNSIAGIARELDIGFIDLFHSMKEAMTIEKLSDSKVMIHQPIIEI